MSTSNSHLNLAKYVKDDEFYTRYSSIVDEVKYYKYAFKDAYVYCNCDCEWSNFWKYFVNNFHNLGLRHLTATGLGGERLDYDGETITRTELLGDAEDHSDKGSCFSSECVAILQECDIVVTNPPFSLFRSFFDLLVNNNKKFLFIGHLLGFKASNVISYFVNRSCWIGVTEVARFNNQKKTVNALWYTNILPTVKSVYLEHLTKSYDPAEYRSISYKGYSGIIVRYVSDIPKDYDGYIFVPVSFIRRYSIYCPFSIIDGVNDLSLDDSNLFLTLIIKRNS